MDLSPKQIVNELDKYIIGQHSAKRAVAIALRNRYRRSRLSDEDREEITPKNIIMKGPTGVGKTEIARRLAKLVKAPFIKVEATKYTEVGYVGRDVESMIRDLVECSARLVHEEKMKEVAIKAEAVAERKLVNVLTAMKKDERGELAKEVFETQILEDLRAGKFDDLAIEIEVVDAPKSMEIVPGSGAEINLGSIFGDILPQKKKKRKMSVKAAMNQIIAEESEKLIDKDSLNAEALSRAEEQGIIFIDEIDKIAGKANQSGADVSREGVQRDILPIVEGSTVMTKYGPVKTDFILFIAAGAFHVSKVEDLIPELQGRFPITVELQSLSKEDFKNILTQPQNAITTQYAKLLKVENIDLVFTDDAIDAVAQISADVNSTSEDIGARRLHTVMEHLLEDISFNAGGDYPEFTVTIDKKYVEEHLETMIRNRDLKKYVL
ncbi:ATP-dependent protease ATPase subunit HslU [Candidatus Borkfalkia ceftriaxoniphila]|uniref:ATP-dependent protease ATPase subunit HslU n=1 Tax=Candidatus Borkfalkia ceftriaxoniphila TaxID=2508949 RepID=A0A4Q2KBD0_9FIRM|nr:ATP-dependent protease ATPase subunit HslU [Candidatus Borkfalkia ceftriaxoniphila]RXZ61904.1 ATP-dependent protease ATPase subunit HslU [Candidatus Borkfalkia ceftriaxoniphila]